MALNGANLGNVTSVTLGFVSASFVVNSSTQITATVPAGVSFGRWRVTTPAFTAVDYDVFTTTPARTDFTFSPAVGAPATTVTLTGTGFATATSVTLGYVPGTFTVDSPTQITATVPQRVEYGRWRINSAAGTLVNEIVFSVSPPTISSFSPLSGGVGSSVTLTGTGFGDAHAVTLGSASAPFTVNSPTQITAKVPAGVAFGRWRVTTAAFTAVDEDIFTVTP